MTRTSPPAVPGSGDDPMPSGAQDAELAEVAARLRLATGLLVRRLRQHDPGQLSPAKLSALLTIESSEPIRSGDLAAKENVAAPTMTRLIGMLVEAGLVHRNPDPTDARGSLVTLAPDGVAALDRVRRERTTLLMARLRRLSDDQRDALAAALPALEALLED